jgi:glycine cleavage system H protein
VLRRVFALAAPSTLPPVGVAVIQLVWTILLCASSNSLSLSLAHEYVKVEGNVGTCGITDFAQSALGDIVFVDLPEVGDVFEKGDSFGSVESVKAASDVYAPVSGKVVEVNSKLEDDPSLVNSEAETGAWFIKLEISNAGETSLLLTPEAYKQHCENEAH